MLNRLLITWLMMTILGYGMALAADVHHDRMAPLSHAMDNSGGVDHPSHSDDDGTANHDHCYHGNAHLLGLKINTDFDFSTGQSMLSLLYTDSFISSTPTRLLRPPRAT